MRNEVSWSSDWVAMRNKLLYFDAWLRRRGRQQFFTEWMQIEWCDRFSVDYEPAGGGGAKTGKNQLGNGGRDWD